MTTADYISGILIFLIGLTIVIGLIRYIFLDIRKTEKQKEENEKYYRGIPPNNLDIKYPRTSEPIDHSTNAYKLEDPSIEEANSQIRFLRNEFSITPPLN